MNDATPLAAVVAVSTKLVLAGSTVPVAVITTPACATALPDASRSWTCTGAVNGTPTVIVAGTGCTSASVFGPTAVAVAVNVVDRAPEVAVSVLAPDAAPTFQEPTVAMPDAFVDVAVPVALPPPLATANATDAP